MLYMSWPCGERMQTSDDAPSRKSIRATGEVKPVGPHQRLTYSGSFQAFQTCSTDASKTRVTTRSRTFTFGCAAVLIAPGPVKSPTTNRATIAKMYGRVVVFI